MAIMKIFSYLFDIWIIHYHPSLKPHGKISWSSNDLDPLSSGIIEVTVPTVTINLVYSLKVLPGESLVAEVHPESYPGVGQCCYSKQK